ncbi:MAG TPA: PfkB family carbohydrate kinase [Candidatus Limnocylindrales bacterium]|nr:PfkB family carbohydrate kinase [Candidatus Limnocylindrales bacterium]
MVTTFAVIGDLSLDIAVAPSSARREGSDTPAEIRIGPGGQGANVAVRLARQGADTRLVTSLADDAAGRLLRDALHADRIRLTTLPAARSTVVLVLLDDAGERTMISDRQALDPGPVSSGLAGAGWIHCSGYPLLDDRGGDALAQLLGARAANVRLSIAGGSVPPDPARLSQLRSRLATAAPDLLVISRDEAESMLATRPIRAAAAAGALQALAPVVIVTSGADGSAAAAGELRLEVAAAALPGPVLDATGSGDAYAAALLVELADLPTWPPPEGDLRAAMEKGSRLGALVARVPGAQGRVAGELAVA